MAGQKEKSQYWIDKKEFYKAVYSGKYSVLGKAIIKSFHEYSLSGDEPYHLLIYNLLGDPALKIR